MSTQTPRSQPILMKFFAGIATFWFALALVMASSVEIDPRTVGWPDGFNITSIGVLGTGCPNGTATYAINNEKDSLTLSFSNFTAKAGPDVNIVENRKGCQVSLGVHVPEGYALGIRSIDYEGHYQLDSNVTASHRSIYYFQGQLNQATSRDRFTGPISGKDYLLHSVFDLTSTVVSGCGAKTVLNINTAVQVSNTANKTRSGEISVKNQSNFGFVWSKC